MHSFGLLEQAPIHSLFFARCTLSLKVGDREVAAAPSVHLPGRRTPRVLDVEDLSQVLGHVVGLEGRAVVALQVLEEAEEQRVHRHLVHVEEDVRDEVSADHDDYDGHEVVVEVRRVDVGQATCQ